MSTRRNSSNDATSNPFGPDISRLPQGGQLRGLTRHTDFTVDRQIGAGWNPRWLESLGGLRTGV